VRAEGGVGRRGVGDRHRRRDLAQVGELRRALRLERPGPEIDHLPQFVDGAARVGVPPGHRARALGRLVEMLLGRLLVTGEQGDHAGETAGLETGRVGPEQLRQRGRPVQVPAVDRRAGAVHHRPAHGRDVGPRDVPLRERARRGMVEPRPRAGDPLQRAHHLGGAVRVLPARGP
jgi:hypothetical protein